MSGPTACPATATCAAHTPRAVRNARVEALRLAAIVGISLFHTMMPWTAQALCDPAAGCSQIGDMLGSDPAVWPCWMG